MNIDAERTAVESMIANWLEATNQGGEVGADGYISFVTEDVVCLPPNAVRAEGRGEVREIMMGFTMADDFSITWSPSSIDVTADGNQAFGYGVYEYSLKDEAGNHVNDVGKWLDVFEKQEDGSWLCSMVMFNSDIAVDGG